jgi:hypothetical protein
VRAGVCLHYTGRLFSDEPTALCREGVNVRESFKPLPLLNGPCFKNGTAADGTTCPKFCGPTPEQLEQHERETDEVIARMLKTQTAVNDWLTAAPWVGGMQRGSIDCPNCKVAGALEVNATPRRAYIQCATPGCVKYEANLGHRKVPA